MHSRDVAVNGPNGHGHSGQGAGMSTERNVEGGRCHEPKKILKTPKKHPDIYPPVAKT